MSEGEKIADFYGLVGLRIAQEGFERANHLLEKVKHGVEAFLGYELVKGITETFEHVLHGGDEAVKTGKKLGITAEAVQELGYAAGLAGVEGDQLTSAMGKFAKNLDEVRQKGSGPAADALTRLGIKMKDLKGETLDQNLEVIAEKFKKMPDGVAKTAIAMELFGKNGKDLIPFLDEGKEGIVELRNEAHELGVVIDNESAESMESFHDDLERVGAGFKGVKTQLVLAILPLIKDMLPKLVETMKEVVAWTKEHKEEIQEFFITLGHGIANAVRIIVQVVQIVAKVFKAVGTAIGQAIGWIVVKAQAVGRALGAAWDFAKNTASALWEFLVKVGTGIVDTFVSVGQGIIQSFRDAFDWVINKAKEVGNTLRNLPVLKQLGDAGAWIGGKLAPKTSNEDVLKNLWKMDHGAEPYDAAKAAAEHPDLAGGGASSSNDATTSPPTAMNAPTAPPPTSMPAPEVAMQIDVHPGPGMDEKQLAQLTAQAVDERLTQVFRHAQADEGTA